METHLIFNCFILISQIKAQKNGLVYGKVSRNVFKLGIEGVIVSVQNSTYKTVIIPK